MKKVLLFLSLLACISFSQKAKAQEVLDGLFEKEHVPNNRPIPFPYIREADVMWAKKVWRIIDLRERMNLPMYYPVQTMDDRFSLIELLYYGIKYEGLTAYSTKGNDEFKVPLSPEQVDVELGAVVDTQEVQNALTGLYEQKTVGGDRKSDEVKQIMVKEIWFFDRNYSTLNVRILGLCPIREFTTSSGEEESITQKQAFWIYYNQARNLLARHEVFNPKNDAMRRTFDDIFVKRYFGSYIVREANMFANRSIENYAQGLDAMLEADRVKNDIATFEHDLWEF
jgi:gliding motility associated protien GldN